MNTMHNWRRAVGAILIAIPVVALFAVIPISVFLGSLGMDIHFTSRARAFLLGGGLIIAMCSCVLAGVRLRNI